MRMCLAELWKDEDMSDRTRQDILRAYNTLIKEVDMDRLTVAMLCREAGVSRATFYRYFQDKYDVMNYNYKLLLDGYVNPMMSTSYKDLYYKLYKYGKSHWKFLRNAFNTEGINSLADYIATYSEGVVETITKQNRNGQGFTEAEKLQCDVYTIGIATMYKRWIFDEYKLSAEEAAQALFEIMPPTLRELWWVSEPHKGQVVIKKRRD